MQHLIALVAVDRAGCAPCGKTLLFALHTAGCLAPLGIGSGQRLARPGSLAESSSYQKHLML